MEKQNFTNSMRNDGKTAEMRNNSAKSGMVGMSLSVFLHRDHATIKYNTKQNSQHYNLATVEMNDILTANVYNIE